MIFKLIFPPLGGEIRFKIVPSNSLCRLKRNYWVRKIADCKSEIFFSVDAGNYSAEKTRVQRGGEDYQANLAHKIVLQSFLFPIPCINCLILARKTVNEFTVRIFQLISDIFSMFAPIPYGEQRYESTKTLECQKVTL